ncbi:MAG: phosphoglucosamine mutase [Clostridia bacterium]|nr:phosphoglucosamine mutase [Clostridia bacterium]
MGVFFGTDGIRGVVNSELTFDLAYKCGNALGASKPNAKILIGRDTRSSGSYLTIAFAGGALSAGAEVVDIGICPTAGIAYLTKTQKADYGVVISASHNPPDYNGIKIFNNKGFKLGDKAENEVERKFVNSTCVLPKNIKNYTQNHKITAKYLNFLISCSKKSLEGLKVVIDASNGASYKIAPLAFKKLGAEVIKINSSNNGKNININCGSLHPEELCKTVVATKSNMGFAFDGDSDRIIACDENGTILDGDMILFMLAKHLKTNKKLNNNTVVGTSHTNMGIELALNNLGIKFIRTDVGDKYVLEKLEQENLSLGGEKSGHIIMREHSTTGDGILSAIKLAEMVKAKNIPLSKLAKVKLFPQCNIDCVVSDKIRIINNQILSNAIAKQEQSLPNGSRIMVRMSGTEPKIRIMVETHNAQEAQKIASEIEKIIKEIDLKE